MGTGSRDSSQLPQVRTDRRSSAVPGAGGRSTDGWGGSGGGSQPGYAWSKCAASAGGNTDGAAGRAAVGNAGTRAPNDSCAGPTANWAGTHAGCPITLIAGGG